MTSWCFINNFKAPPSNLPAPKPLPNCNVTLDKWCSSKQIASDCGVSINLSLQRRNSFYYFYPLR